MIKECLPELLRDCLEKLGGEATIVQVCKYFWNHYEDELTKSGDLLYTWQYDIRWAATELRKNGKMLEANKSPRGLWQLK